MMARQSLTAVRSMTPQTLPDESEPDGCSGRRGRPSGAVSRASRRRRRLPTTEKR